MVKNPPVMQGNGGEGLIPGLGRSPGGGHTTHSSILAWKLPWTEESGRLQSMELQRIRYDSVAFTLKNRIRGLKYSLLYTFITISSIAEKQKLVKMGQL